MKKRAYFSWKLWLVLEPDLVVWHNSCCCAPEDAHVMALFPSRWKDIPYYLPLMTTGCKGTVNVPIEQLEGLAIWATCYSCASARERASFDRVWQQGQPQ